jgi:SAM-dependent methyltransferase
MDAASVKQEVECAICRGRGGSIHHVREMMFGIGKAYPYFLCDTCGCMQLTVQVASEDQYPPGYYAHRPQPRARGLRALLRRWRNRGVFRGGVARILARVAGYPVRGAERWFHRTGVRSDSAILDVGCGTGDLVRDLSEAGFTRVRGIDPFLPDESRTTLAPLVRKSWLHQETGEYDVVMLHHVLEHMPEQESVFFDIARLLRPGGMALVRIPLLPNDAWDHYRENWVQLDAPRHLYVHSAKSLALLAGRAGLRVEHVEYDSTEFQFIGSELYSKGVPLTELRTSFSERHRYARMARRLNALGRGDQAAFYLRRLR